MVVDRIGGGLKLPGIILTKWVSLRDRKVSIATFPSSVPCIRYCLRSIHTYARVAAYRHYGYGNSFFFFFSFSYIYFISFFFIIEEAYIYRYTKVERTKSRKKKSNDRLKALLQTLTQ